MIVINDLTFGYKNKLIFNQASLILPDKGVIILKGDNGSGKSTLLKIISGELIKDDIKLEYNHITIDEKNKNYLTNHITYISQTNNFVSFLNASENASLNAMINKKGIKPLTLLDDSKFKNKKETQLSNGEKVLITLERAINENKDIILLDECSDFLDDYNTNLLINNINALADKSLIVIVSHDERIINAFKNHINIENQKLIANFKCVDNANKINENHESSKQKSSSYITKKLVRKQIPFISLFFILLFLFNSVFLAGFSFLSYSKIDSYMSCLEENYYQLSSTSYRRVTINETSFKVTSDTNSYIKKETMDRISNDFDIPYFSSLGTNLFISNGQKIGKAKISSKEYDEQSKYLNIKDDKLQIYLNSYKTYISIPYEVIDDEDTSLFSIVISKSDLDAVIYNEPISVCGAIWENDNFLFSNNESIKKLLSNEGRLNFFTKQMYEDKYNVSLNDDISDDKLYISKTLDQMYHTNNELNFFNFENVDMDEYTKSFFNLNEIFHNTYLVSDFENNSLISNEVIISDHNYKKLVSLIDLIDNPFIYLKRSDLHLVKKYYQDNIKLSEYYLFKYKNYTGYKLNDFYKFLDLYNENVTFYSILLVLLLIPELSIIYIVIKGYKTSNSNNYLIISRYFNKKETSFIFSIPYLLSLITSFIVSLLGSTLLLKIIFKNLEFSIMPFKINIISIIILFMLNTLLYFFMKAIKNK